jgi:hypothetical protein
MPRSLKVDSGYTKVALNVKGLSNAVRRYKEKKLAEGTILYPPNLDMVNRLQLYQIIRTQAELIAELKRGR